MKVKPDKKAVLDGNPKVDQTLVRNFERLDRELKALGVHSGPQQYSLNPPLGGSKQAISFHNRVSA